MVYCIVRIAVQIHTTCNHFVLTFMPLCFHDKSTKVGFDCFDGIFVGNFGYILPIHIFIFYVQEYIEYKNAPLLLQIPIKNALDQKEEYGNLW